MDNQITFTDYNILSPDFIINYLNEQLSYRDLSGITNGLVQAISVSREHPFIRLAGQIADSGEVNLAGLIPAISVIELSDNEDVKTMGNGYINGVTIESDFFDAFVGDLKKMGDRIGCGVITDGQLERMRIMMDGNGGKLYLSRTRHYQRERVGVSLWTESSLMTSIIGRVIRSILYDLKDELARNNVEDMDSRVDKGLYNQDFGRKLYGEEHSMEFVNIIRNYTVSTDIPEYHEIDQYPDYKVIGEIDG